MVALAEAPSSRSDLTLWRIDPAASQAEFRIRKRVMLIKKLTVNGRFADIAGSVRFDPVDPTRSEARVTIGAASVSTVDPSAPVPALDAQQAAMRDQHLREAAFFDVKRWPQMTFESVRIEADESHAHGYQVHGLLTVKDVTRPIVLDASYELENDLQIRATARLNRREFGMTFNNLALRIADEFEIRVVLRAVPVDVA
jgi:polyisoprenoid-binding protein YceI